MIHQLFYTGLPCLRRLSVARITRLNSTGISYLWNGSTPPIEHLDLSSTSMEEKAQCNIFKVLLAFTKLTSLVIASIKVSKGENCLQCRHGRHQSPSKFDKSMQSSQLSLTSSVASFHCIIRGIQNFSNVQEYNIYMNHGLHACVRANHGSYKWISISYIYGYLYFDTNQFPSAKSIS